MLEAQDISVERGRRALVRDVSLVLEPGQSVAIVGPNGAGKTTLLRALSGEIAPTAGKVLLHGRELARWSKEELARARAVLPQSSSLDFPFTVGEVVLMGRMPHGRSARRDMEIAQAALELVGAAQLADRLYTTLSGGERQRVQLARVLAQIWEGDEPRYLLLDEPTASLDLAHQQATMRTARRFARRGVGVVAVLHDLNLAAQHADRIVVLSDGRVVAAGPARDALTPDIIRGVFGIEACMITHPRFRSPLIAPRAWYDDELANVSTGGRSTCSTAHDH